MITTMRSWVEVSPRPVMKLLTCPVRPIEVITKLRK